MFGASENSLFYNGIFLTIVGQTTFIAAYSMLIFIARLQRFDYAQEEAARDLGATPGQSFRKVLLPFLKPAIGNRRPARLPRFVRELQQTPPCSPALPAKRW